MTTRTTPCATCPFRKDSKRGELGGSPAHVFIGQAFGKFYIPCHTHIDYTNPNWRHDVSVPQCAGAGMFRKKINPRPIDWGVIDCKDDPNGMTFDTPFEFMFHHEVSMTRNEVLFFLSQSPPHILHWHELNRAGAYAIKQ